MALHLHTHRVKMHAQTSVFAARHAGHHAVASWRAFKSLLELSLVFLLAAMFGLSLLRTTHTDVELLRYRNAAEEVASSLRAMQGYAQGRRLTVQFLFDEQQSVIRVISMRNPAQGWQTIEQTLWLPEGLRIAESPKTITFSPATVLPVASIVLEAAAYNKSFRILLKPGGVVYVYENSLS